GVQAHTLSKLVAGERGLADLEEGVGQVLAQVGAGWGGLDGGEEGGHGYIVIAGAEGGVGAVGIGRLGGRQHGRDGEEDGDAHIPLEIVVVGGSGEGSQGNWGGPSCARMLAGKRSPAETLRALRPARRNEEQKKMSELCPDWHLKPNLPLPAIDPKIVDHDRGAGSGASHCRGSNERIFAGVQVHRHSDLVRIGTYPFGAEQGRFLGVITVAKAPKYGRLGHGSFPVILLIVQSQQGELRRAGNRPLIADVASRWEVHIKDGVRGRGAGCRPGTRYLRFPRSVDKSRGAISRARRRPDR